MKKLYAVISRTVEHNMGIDWIYPNIMTSDYEEIKKKFDEEKEYLKHKLSDDDDVIIIRDEDRMFEVTYEKFSMCRYVKIIDLY